MKEKKEFQKVEVEIVHFENNDVIATSATGPTGNAGGFVWEEEDKE